LFFSVFGAIQKASALKSSRFGGEYNVMVASSRRVWFLSVSDIKIGYFLMICWLIRLSAQWVVLTERNELYLLST